MKALTAKVLAALLLGALSLGLAERATAEKPVTGRLQDAPAQTTPPAVKAFLHILGSETLAQAKQDAVRLARLLRGPQTQTATGGAPLVSSGTSSAALVTGFDGVDQFATFADPPDGAIAVGPTHIVEAVNNALSVWTKTYDGTGRLSAVTQSVVAVDLNGFLGQNPACLSGANNFFGLVSDPSLDYDVASDRFMVSMISFDQLFLASSLCIAVTQTGDPTGGWFIYAFPISPDQSLLDFPRAVVGADGHIYLTGNLFLLDTAGNATFDSARVYAFKTSEMYSGADTTPQFVTVGNDPESGTPADSLTPARGIGVVGMYFVSSTNPEGPAAASSITLWKWTDPFGSNVFTRQGFVTVSSFTQPPPGIQLGGFPAGVTDCEQAGALCIETNDTRNITAYWFGNTVWAAHTVGCMQNGELGPCVQWYQLGNLDGAPTLLRQGFVDDATNPGRQRYFPSVAVDKNGNALFGYGYSSATEYPGVAYTTISATGDVGPETVLKTGDATFDSPRYGDYAATTVDPHDNFTIWHVQEYAKAGQWGTWIAGLQIGGTPVPPSLSVNPAAQDFGTVLTGSTADRTFVVQNTGGSMLTGSVSATLPFSVVSGGTFNLTLGATQTVVVRFSPTASGVVSDNVSFTSNAGDLLRPVTGTVPGVDSITPSTVDLATPPASFTLTGNGFANLGFGLPVVNFTRGTTILAQARATSLNGSTALTVPFPTAATAIAPNLPGLSVGAVQAQVYLQTSSGGFTLIGGVPLTVVNTTPPPGVNSITPSTIDLASPPASFAITGNGFVNNGFGLPVVNFSRNGAVLAQARATSMTGSTSLTVPFPTAATALAPNLPGLSAGPVQAQVYVQIGPVSYTLIGSVGLTVNDNRVVPGVSSITPSTIDLATPPASFTITGNGFANNGFGLPVVNFTRGSTVLAQARATAMTGSTTLTVPFPTAATAIAPNLPGLSAGTVQAQVYVQTGTFTYTLIGSATLTINDTRTGPPTGTVTGITPSTIDLATPPASFTITGTGFANFGFGLPVINFTRNGAVLGQARATALNGSASMTVPFPTAATALAPGLPGLSAGPVQVQVYLQTAATSFTLIGSVNLTVNDTRSGPPSVGSITPNTIDLASPPASFTITGNGFANVGFGLPVVNFARGSTVLAQARATAMTPTSLTVPYPTSATALAPNLPGLSAGPVQAQVYLQTGPVSYNLIGSVSLTVNDTRVVPTVTSITPNAIDLKTPPASFTITGAGFANNGFGLPVVNFTRGTTVLAQARATAMTGSTILTVPFPTPATAIAPNLPGLSAGTVQAQVYVQTGTLTYTLIGSVTLTITDTR